MAVTGEIAEEARNTLNVTWDDLKDDARYGESFLQRKIDQTKYRIFGEIVEPNLEDTLYTPTIIEYVGKVAALGIIPPAAEYWAQQGIQDSSGQRISKTWVDRVEKLWEIYDRLVGETKELAALVGELNPTIVPATRRRKPVRVTIGINDSYLTPNVEDLPRQAAVPTGA